MQQKPGYREEHDTLGTVLVPQDHLWGAQTQRSFQNFPIGTETMPREIIRAFAILKKAAARANQSFGKLTEHQADLIAAACDAILAGDCPGEFPLKVWQTGSGTQSNMNVNEVISHLCARMDPDTRARLLRGWHKAVGRSLDWAEHDGENGGN